jgi:hypothetical protein
MLSGAVSMGTLDDHVRNILATWFRYGVFDRSAYRDDDSQIDKPAHAADARQIERQAATLLTNSRGLLPLRRARLKRIAVIGKAADKFVTGGGSGNVTPFQFTSVLDGIQADAAPGARVTYDDGSDPAAAIADARAADVVVVVASDYYTEGADRSCLTLECPPTSGDQDALIEQVAQANPRTVVVLESGGPDLTPWRNQVGALLEAWYPGGPGGQAVADVLFGKTDPGGRLPVTFPASAGQLPTTGDDPAAYPGIGTDVYYNEGVLVGYRWHDAKGEQPAFPFGYGLSYTRFPRARRAAKAAEGVRQAIAPPPSPPHGDDQARRRLVLLLGHGGGGVAGCAGLRHRDGGQLVPAAAAATHRLPALKLADRDCSACPARTSAAGTMTGCEQKPCEVDGMSDHNATIHRGGRRTCSAVRAMATNSLIVAAARR